jgi:hypothetical protein
MDGQKQVAFKLCNLDGQNIVDFKVCMNSYSHDSHHKAGAFFFELETSR